MLDGATALVGSVSVCTGGHIAYCIKQGAQSVSGGTCQDIHLHLALASAVITVDVAYKCGFSFRTGKAFSLSDTGVEILFIQKVGEEFIRFIITLFFLPKYRITKKKEKLYLVDVSRTGSRKFLRDIRVIAFPILVGPLHHIVGLRIIFLNGFIDFIIAVLEHLKRTADVLILQKLI